jgi:predicted RNase H-like nuclease
MSKREKDDLESLAVLNPSEKNNLIPINQGTSVEEKAAQPHPIGVVLNDFLCKVRSIQRTCAIVFPHVLSWLKGQHDRNLKKLNKYTSQNEDGSDVYKAASAHQAAEIFQAIREIDGLGGMKIPDILQRSLYTQLFSEYDAFLGSLLKVIYSKKPELLKGISRQISFNDLLDYENINAVKLDMLEKEVETFRRNSYPEQFTALESKFGLKLRSFPEWGEFIELSQRRNLIVHNGGFVSDQYLLVCDRENHKFTERPKPGDLLHLNGAYLSRATIVVSKVAFMLCHTLWRKIFPIEIEIAHNEANLILFDILSDKRWKTASVIAEFALTEPMKYQISDIDLRIRTINAAIAMKFSGNEDGCKKILKLLDWTAALRDFRLAIAVLSDNYSKAAELMISIGKRGELVEEVSYHNWPLFQKFRESEEFLRAYFDVYGTSFITESIRHTTEVAEANQAAFDKGLDTVDVQAESPRLSDVATDSTPDKSVQKTSRSKKKSSTGAS